MKPDRKPADAPAARGTDLAPVLEQNIEKLLARRAQETSARSRQDRLADTVTRFTGSMTFVYIHLVVFGSWILWNALPHSLPKFDPSLVVLAMAASVEAIFLSTFVLISQNRMTSHAAKQADLDLQVSLLAEHEITRLIGMVTEISNKLGLAHTQPDDLDALKKDIAPEKVLDKIEEEYRNHS